MTLFKAKRVWPKLPTSLVQRAMKLSALSTRQIDETTPTDDVAVAEAVEAPADEAPALAATTRTARTLNRKP